LIVRVQIDTKVNRPATRVNAASQLRPASFNRTAVAESKFFDLRGRRLRRLPVKARQVSPPISIEIKRRVLA
jgi:hypothetical protein